jgi:predicted membrane metal-binding protein
MTISILVSASYLLAGFALLFLLWCFNHAKRNAHDNKINPQSIFQLTAAGLILGILLQRNLGCSALLAPLIALINFIAFTLRKHNKLIFSIMILCAYSALGALLLYTYEQRQAMLIQSIKNETVNLTGIVKEVLKTPSNSYKEVITLHVTSVPAQGSPEETPSFTLQCFCNEETDVMPDDVIEIQSIKIKTQSPLQKGHKPTFYDYMTLHDIQASSFEKKLNYTLLHRPTLSFKRITWQARSRISNALSESLTHKTFTLVSSVFLGNKKQIFPKNLQKQFSLWGISHYLARSGLHLALLHMFWRFLISALPLTIYIKQCILTFLIMLYATLTWGSISFTRALLTFLLTSLGIVYMRQTRSSHTVLILGILLLLGNPLYILFLDFQLSFLLTYALCIL